MFKTLAIVPARIGSKGIKQKNIKEILGKPLIEYTLEQIRESKLIDDFIVSSDSDYINQIGNRYGAISNGIRPKYLSDDKALTIDVVKYELNKIKNVLEKYTHIILLQPTCPLRKSVNIDQSIIKLQEKEGNSLISVVEVKSYHPLRMKLVHNDRLYNYVDTGYEDMRPRQELPKVYIRNGAVYLAKIDDVLSLSTFSNPDCISYIMNEEESVNIDSENDFFLAEYYLKKRSIQL